MKTPSWFTILIVEDDPNDRFLIQAAFEDIDERRQIRMVNSGREAIAYLRGEGKFANRTVFQYPSYIMIDLKMSDGDGLSVLAFLKSTPQFAIIPTVVFSSSNDLDDIKKSYALGASAYLIKPQIVGELKRTAKTLIEFWTLCEVPQVDASGRQLVTESRGKLGERFDILLNKS